MACAADELVECTVDNCYSLDFVWVQGRELKTASKWVSQLPFQNARFYHQSAVRFMLRFGISGLQGGFGVRGATKTSSRSRQR